MPAETTSLFLRGVPRTIVREAKAAAAREGKTLASFVTRSVERALQAPAEGDRGTRADLDESAHWYEANKARLLRRYRGRWLAIVGKEVLDSDADWEALAERMIARLGATPFFMPRVEPEERIARLRSPRVARG